MQRKKVQAREAPGRGPDRAVPAPVEQHWGQGAASALARLRHQERAGAQEGRALRNGRKR
jgi:hypothetical protein